MADWFGPPPSASADVKIYVGNQTSSTNQWQTWVKPRGKTMLYAFAMGSGAGGGGGFSAAAAARGGGGGGGSAAYAKCVFPLTLLPDILYLTVPGPSAGGAAGATGSSGVLSLINVYPDNSTDTNAVLISGGSTVPTGGGGGTGVAAGAAGGAGALKTTQALFSSYGFNSAALAGVVGLIGGVQTGAVGTSSPFSTSIINMGGPGGAGTTSADFAGAGATAISNSYISIIAPAVPAAGSNNGSDGPTLWKPFFSYCGCSGSASNAGIGGNGGNSAPGSGGPGGGGGTTGGSGGTGGPGLIMLIAW